MEIPGAAQERVRAFCELLHFLHKTHLDWTRQPKKEKLQRLNKRVIETTPFQTVTAEKLKNVTESAIRFGRSISLDHRELIFLEPPPKQVLLPALSLSSSLQDSKLQVVMALFTFESESEENLAAMGFRFETPEEKGEKHSYYHAQMIRSFKKNSPPALPTPMWLPDSLPAFPLSAKTPFSLFLGALMGLYGLDYLSSKWKDQRFFGFLKPDMDDLKSGCGYC